MAAAGAMINPQPDFDVAISFLPRSLPGGPWVLTAVNPGGKGIQTVAFVNPDRLRDALRQAFADGGINRNELRKDRIDV